LKGGGWGPEDRWGRGSPGTRTEETATAYGVATAGVWPGSARLVRRQPGSGERKKKEGIFLMFIFPPD